MIKYTDPSVSADRCFLRAIEDEQAAERAEQEGRELSAKALRRSAAARRGAAKRILNQHFA